MGSNNNESIGDNAKCVKKGGCKNMNILALVLGAMGLTFGISAFLLQISIIKLYKKQNESLKDNYAALQYGADELSSSLRGTTEELKAKRRKLRDIDEIVEDNTLTDYQKIQKIRELIDDYQSKTSSK